MRKTLQFYQMLIGMVICACVVISAFFPRVVLYPGQMLDDMAEVVVDAGYDYLKELDQLHLFTDITTQKSKEDIIKAIQEHDDFFGDESVGISSVSLLFLTKETLKWKIDSTLEGFDEEFETEIARHIDTEKISKGIYAVIAPELWKIKICLFCIYVLPIIFFVLLLLTYFRKWNILAVEISGFVYLVIAAGAEIYWRLVLRKEILTSYQARMAEQTEIWLDKLGKMIGDAAEQLTGGNLPLGVPINIAQNLLKTKVKDALEQIFSGLEDALEVVLKNSTGFGMVMVEIALVLLFLWLILNLCIKTPVSQMTGNLRIVNGVLNGADIFLRPGDEIVIGTDPAAAQLIFPGVKIAPEHCKITFSKNGTGYVVETLMGVCVLGSLGFGKPMLPGTRKKIKQKEMLHFLDQQGVIADAICLM